VKFTVMLMVRRLERPDSVIPFTFFTLGPDGMTMTPVSDTFFQDDPGKIQLRDVEFPNRARAARARFAAFAVSAVWSTSANAHLDLFSDSVKEGVWVDAVEGDEREVWYAPVKRRRFGNPILGRWEIWQDHMSPYTDPFMQPTIDTLKSLALTSNSVVNHESKET